jgi:prepilin-type processing-associated H-X9-DG protein
MPRPLALPFACLLGVVLFVLSMTAALARAAGAGDAAPLVRQATVAVAYVDLTRVDAQAAADWLAAVYESNQSVPATDRDALVAQIRAGAPELAKRLQAGRDAGLREAYAVFNMPNSPMGDDPLIAVRLAEGATPDAALAALFGEAPRGDTVKVIGDLHVMGNPRQIEQLDKSTPAQRAEFDSAVGVAKDAPLAVLVVPPAGSLNVFPLMMPKLPDEFGGVDTKDLCDGVEALVLFGNGPADPRLDLHILCANPKVLADAIAKTRAALTTTLQSGKMPSGAMSPSWAKTASLLLEALPALVAGEGVVTAALDEPALRKLADVSLAPMIDARRQAERVRGASNARALLQGVMLHAAENDGRLPATLDEAAKPFGAQPEQLANLKSIPGTDGEQFVYLGSADTRLSDIKRPSEVVMLMQPVGEKPATERIIVGFADGHVEMLTVDEFRSRMKDGTIRTLSGNGI